jgi:hypothetical protein
VALSPRTSALLRQVGSALVRAASSRSTSTSGTSRSRSRSTRSTSRPGPGGTAPSRPRPPGDSASPSSRGEQQAYRGDFTGRASITYTPSLDGDADPGEVVWAWVPYEEDHRQGKDRPVFVIARVDGDLLGLMLTSKDHDRRQGPDDHRRHLDIGSGDWDSQGRPSEVRLDRVLRLAPSAVRREGAILDRERFDEVAAAARDALGW